jgi:hypothetical protein
MDLTLKGVLPIESTSESTSDAVGLGGQLSHGIDRYVRAGVTTAHKKGLVSEYFTSDHAERSLETVTSSKQKNLETRFLVLARVNFLSRVASNLENGRTGQKMEDGQDHG